MKFAEAQLESAIMELLGVEGYPHIFGVKIEHQPKEIITKLRGGILPKLISGEL